MRTELFVDAELYPLDAIMGASYVFTDRCHVLLDREKDGKVKVTLEAKAGTTEPAFSAVVGEFQNELLAQALRRRIADRHEKVRELIVARALFGAAPEIAANPAPPDDAQLGLDARFVPADSDDFLEDPLGIAVPWEEKYGTSTPGGEKPKPTEPQS